MPTALTKSGDQKKTAVIIVRLTPEQKTMITKAATESGATISGLIRDFLKKKTGK